MSGWDRLRKLLGIEKPLRICLNCHSPGIEKAVAVNKERLWWCTKCGTYYDNDVTMAKRPGQKPRKIKDTMVDGENVTRGETDA